MGILNIGPRLTETITVKRPSGHTQFGDATLGAAFTCSARLERKKQQVPDAGGRSERDAIVVFTQTELRLGDLVWLPGANTADQDAADLVIDVATQRALDGAVSHYEVTLG